VPGAAGAARGMGQARLARWAARRVRALAGLRESAKFAIVRVLGVVRQTLREAGGELAAAGVLARADDIFFLRLGELEGLARGEAEASSRPCGGGCRTAERYGREMLRRQVPRLLLSDGRRSTRGWPAPEGWRSHPGWQPRLAGVAEGAVRVILDPRGAAWRGRDPGVSGTDPPGRRFSLVASGLVTEVGGLMTTARWWRASTASPRGRRDGRDGAPQDGSARAG